MSHFTVSGPGKNRGSAVSSHGAVLLSARCEQRTVGHYAGGWNGLPTPVVQKSQLIILKMRNIDLSSKDREFMKK